MFLTNPLTHLLWALPLTTTALPPLSSSGSSSSLLSRSLPQINTTALLPWQITALGTSSPPGMPAVHPYSHLGFTIADPNTIVLGTTHFGDAAFPPSATNCSVWWMSFGPDPREGDGGSDGKGKGGWVNACDPMQGGGIHGKWTFVVTAGRDPGRGVTTDLGLQIGLEEAVSLETGDVVSVRFEGEAVFSVGEEMAGTCGGSGVCSWGLKSELVPVEVKQRLVGVVCVAGTCKNESEE